MNRAIDSIIREKNITVILAAHRLSSIARAERVIVLENGVVSEEGRYDVLVSIMTLEICRKRNSADEIAMTRSLGEKGVASGHLWQRNSWWRSRRRAIRRLERTTLSSGLGIRDERYQQHSINPMHRMTQGVPLSSWKSGGNLKRHAVLSSHCPKPSTLKPIICSWPLPLYWRNSTWLVPQ